jgi:hypothetical protein
MGPRDLFIHPVLFCAEIQNLIAIIQDYCGMWKALQRWISVRCTSSVASKQVARPMPRLSHLGIQGGNNRGKPSRKLGSNDKGYSRGSSRDDDVPF